jgi:hypothetical protein
MNLSLYGDDDGGMKDLEEEDRELRGMSSSSSNLFFSVSGRIVEDVNVLFRRCFHRSCSFSRGEAAPGGTVGMTIPVLAWNKNLRN